MTNLQLLTIQMLGKYLFTVQLSSTMVFDLLFCLNCIIFFFTVIDLALKHLVCVCVCAFSSAWLEGEDDPVVARVNQRIEDITGLTVKTAELLQVRSSSACQPISPLNSRSHAIRY